MSPEAIGRTIQLILAPVVMFSACSVFVGGVLNHYTSVGDRIRALTRERLELLRDGGGALSREQLDEIDRQLPELLHRHRLIHHALLAVYASIGILVLTMCIIALTATIPAEWVGPLVYGVFLLSVLAVLVGVVRITATNLGPEAAPLYVLPTLWFRNTWAWGTPDERPLLRQIAPGVVEAQHGQLGTYTLACDGAPEVLFTENESDA